MKIELLSIGSELLTGKTINTNAAFIGDQLLMQGYKIAKIQTIEDTHAAIESALKSACERADFVITTGGLGPTGDDLTKECVATLFGKKMQYHAHLEKQLDERFPGIPGHENQATYPEGALLLENPHGTALGFIVEDKVVCLPGVPSQMKTIFVQSVLPYMKQHFPPEYYAQTVYIAGRIESDVDPTLRLLEKKYAGVEIGICPSWGRLSVYCIGKDVKSVEACISQIQVHFSEAIYSNTDPDISSVIHTLLQKKKKTLGLAESCTGGYLSSQITKHAGASEYFLGSLIAYSNEAKESLLKVSQKTLLNYGAVSEETAREMVIGVKKAFNTSFGVSITGIAGPTGGSKEKPIGTVWIALINEQDEIITKKLTRGGDRQKIIEYATNMALQMLWRELL